MKALCAALLVFLLILVGTLPGQQNAETGSPESVRITIPEKDKAALQGMDTTFGWMVRSPPRKEGRSIGWRSDSLKKRVQVEGLCWNKAVVYEGGTIKLKGVDIDQLKANGRPVRVLGTLQYVGTLSSRFGNIPPFFYIEVDSLEVIEQVTDPNLVGVWME